MWVRASTALPEFGRDMIVASSAMRRFLRGHDARFEDLSDPGWASANRWPIDVSRMWARPASPNESMHSIRTAS